MLKDNRFLGFILSILVGLGVYFISFYIGGINAIILGLLLGIAVGNVFKIPETINPGIKFAGSKMLEFSILFLAFSINLTHIAGIGFTSFILVIIAVFGTLFLTLFLAKKFNCPNSTGCLVGFGTAICGSSAIAALAPGITQNKEDVGISLAVVNLMGTIGMLLMPLGLVFLNISDIDAGVLIGATLHSVGNVAGAGYGMNETIGDTALAIKMARVAMLSPAVILFTFLVNRKNNEAAKTSYKLPYYLWGFIGITILVSVITLPDSFLKAMSEGGKILLTIAMFAIGMKVSFKELYSSGKKALWFGFAIFFLQIIVVASFMIITSYF